MSARFDINIIVFLAPVGALVVIITRAGGSKAYGELMNRKLKSRGGASLATAALGALIFIDDYCNCLTVGTVMKPVTDRYKVSMAKPAYLIDATAAPICIIAPISSRVTADMILVLAWTISGVCRDLLMTGEFVGEMVKTANIPIGILPVIVFVIASALSFSMGTFGILIPIVFEICEKVASELMIITLAASLAGSVFGDHCSPISDTTIMASAGAGCDHISHVSTRIPYCLTVAACCCAGYIAGGFTGGNRIVTFGAGLVSLLASLKFLHAKYGA